MLTEKARRDKLKFKSIVGVETDRQLREETGVSQLGLENIFMDKAHKNTRDKLLSFYAMSVDKFNEIRKGE